MAINTDAIPMEEDFPTMEDETIHNPNLGQAPTYSQAGRGYGSMNPLFDPVLVEDEESSDDQKLEEDASNEHSCPTYLVDNLGKLL